MDQPNKWILNIFEDSLTEIWLNLKKNGNTSLTFIWINSTWFLFILLVKNVAWQFWFMTRKSCSDPKEILNSKRFWSPALQTFKTQDFIKDSKFCRIFWFSEFCSIVVTLIFKHAFFEIFLGLFGVSICKFWNLHFKKSFSNCAKDKFLAKCSSERPSLPNSYFDSLDLGVSGLVSSVCWELELEWSNSVISFLFTYQNE